MRRNLIAGFFGTLFGFAFSAAGLNQYDTLHAMLLLENLEPFLIMGSAVATAMPLLFLLERRKSVALTGEPVTLRRTSIRREHIAGGAIFGAGWAITGACPGTASTTLGSGSLMGIVLIAGMLAGVWLQDVHANRRPLIGAGTPLVAEPASGQA